MKKDKAVRKAELKAALIKKLKSMAAPLVILLLIAVGIGIVIFWRDEPEPEKIIKVNGYEGDEEEFVLENDQLKFVMDAQTTQFTITVKETGAVWYSNPLEADADPLALNTEKEKLKSTLLLTYSTVNGVDTLYPNYTYSMEKKIYEVEASEDSIKVFYSVGDMEKEYIVPPVIVQKNMEDLLKNMSESDASLVKQYYKIYDINHLGKKDNKEELLASYPILETEIAYVSRSLKDNLKSKFETIFAAAGYTLEDYARDKELDLTVTVSDKPVFNVNMSYRLEGGDLVVEVAMGEIEYEEEYPLLYLSVLPYFGAGTTSDEGYMLVPEGGGAIIDFNNGKLAQNSYYANVYGWDMSQDRSAIVHETQTYYNTFGIAKGENSFLCILEKGAPYASIQADISGRNNSYNWVNAIFNIARREQYDVSDKYNGKMFVYEEELPDDTLVNRYRFIDSGEYVDMAKVYQNYLADRYPGYFTPNEETETPTVIEILGAADKVTQFFGIPMSRPLKLTSYREAQEILEDLCESGIKNISVKLTGWMNGGINQKILKKVNLVGELGSKKDLQSLIQYAADHDMDFYLDGITNYAYDSGIWDGFLQYRDAARFASDEKAELYQYSSVSYGKRESQDTYYLLNAGLIDEMAVKLCDTAKKYQANVSFHDIGKDLSSDFSEDAVVSRQAALESQESRLRQIKDSGMNVMINMGNDYAVPYSDIITNMDLAGDGYTIIDRKVPVFQMALHGYVNYTGESLNLAQDYEEELLISAEYGAGLSFTLMKESCFALQNTEYSRYFGADYSGWQEKLTQIYTRYNEELGHTFCQRMVDHEYVQEKLSCTTYEDGTRVYVNYSYKDQTVDGKVIPARDYTVVR